MTDTPTDAAPEAITQADREAVARQGYPEAHAMLRDLFTADKISDTMIRVARDHMMQFRRLTSHSAGEGLREAAELLCQRADEVQEISGGTVAHSDMLVATIAVRHILEATPPSDAGSTTRSGGEGVTAGMKPWTGQTADDGLEFGPAPTDWDGGDVLYRDGRIGLCDGDWSHGDQSDDIIAYTPNTTPSPDASPDTRSGGEGVRPMGAAPKDGTMIRLLVDYTDGGGPLEDEHPLAWTIGFNGFEDHGVDEWKFAGWCWTHDHFVQGSGTPVGWLPWSNPSTTTTSPDAGEYRRGLAEGARLVREYAASGANGALEVLATLILNQSAPDCAGIEKHWDGAR